MKAQDFKKIIREIVDKVLFESIDVDKEKSFDIILRNGDKIKNVKFLKNGEWYQDTKTGRKVGGKVPEGAKVVNENQPAVKEPITKPTTPPVKKPGPFSPDKDKNNIPKKIPAKAGLKEEEMLQKIVARFKSKK